MKTKTIHKWQRDASHTACNMRVNPNETYISLAWKWVTCTDCILLNLDKFKLVLDEKTRKEVEEFKAANPDWEPMWRKDQTKELPYTVMIHTTKQEMRVVFRGFSAMYEDHCNWKFHPDHVKEEPCFKTPDEGWAYISEFYPQYHP